MILNLILKVTLLLMCPSTQLDKRPINSELQLSVDQFTF